jgi:hypothetical protein
MLPPPLKDPEDYDMENEDDDDYDQKDASSRNGAGSSSGSSGSLSSWEQFLGAKPRPSQPSLLFSSSSTSNSGRKRGSSLPLSGKSYQNGKSKGGTENDAEGQVDEDEDELMTKKPPSMSKLPSIHDLFPPDLSLTSRGSTGGSTSFSSGKKSAPPSRLSSSVPGNSSSFRSTTKRSKGFNSRSSSSPAESESPRETSSSSSLPLTSALASSGPRSAATRRQPSSSSSQSSDTQQPDSSLFDDQEQDISGRKANADSNTQKQTQQQQQQNPLQGVLPVSDLFYRSSQSIDAAEADDEELPFSAEQSDQLAVDHNKVKIRRNQAAAAVAGSKSSGKTVSSSSSKSVNSSNKKSSSSSSSPKGGGRNTRRKMVRRGMEMLVGGVPINADPPQRSFELWYNYGVFGGQEQPPWYATISLNTRDFGPLLHASSQHELSRTELGLFCEHFVHNTMKWDVCPKELRDIVQDYYRQQEKQQQDEEEDRIVSSSTDGDNATAVSSNLSLQQSGASAVSTGTTPTGKYSVEEEANIMSMLLEQAKAAGGFELIKEGLGDAASGGDADEDSNDFLGGGHRLRKRSKRKTSTTGKGFGKPSTNKPNKPSSRQLRADEAWQIRVGGELHFTMGISQAELEDEGGDAGRPKGTTLKNVLRRGIQTCMEKELQQQNSAPATESYLLAAEDQHFVVLDDVVITKLELKELDDGTTLIVVQMMLISKPSTASEIEMEKGAHKLNRALTQAIDDGELPLSMAAAALEEKSWSREFRERIYEEFLFEEDDEDKALWDDDEGDDDATEEAGAIRGESSNIPSGEASSGALGAMPATKAKEREIKDQVDDPDDNDKEEDGPFGVSNKPSYARDDLFMGGGNDGVFWDYSESSMKEAPFHGKLGPKLLQAVEERAQEHPPKVITIGDVHGCVDELQELLRQCDYHPGDLVVFLGDLVSKGPDSISVVQMGREIGAIGVRGEQSVQSVFLFRAYLIFVRADLCGGFTSTGTSYVLEIRREQANVVGVACVHSVF